MISYEQVQRDLQGYSPEQIGKLLGPALRGEVAMPQSGGRNDEPAEDFFARLLASDKTLKATRAAIIQACRQLYIELLPVASGDGPQATSIKDEAAFPRLCRLINVAKPAELEVWVLAVLKTHLSASATVRPEILGACVRAAMAYPVMGEEMGVWDTLLARPALAAYGFQALLALRSPREKIVRELVRLWVRRIADDWPTDAALLTLQASRQLQADNLIEEVLTNLRQHHHHLWQGVVVELQSRSATRKWLERGGLRQDLWASSLESLMKLLAVPSDIPDEQVPTNGNPSYDLAEGWDNLSAWPHSQFDDPLSGPLGTASQQYRQILIYGRWMAKTREPAETRRIETNVQLSRSSWLSRSANQSRRWVANQPKMMILDNLLPLGSEANAATRSPLVDFATIGSGMSNFFASAQRLALPGMIVAEEII